MSQTPLLQRHFLQAMERRIQTVFLNLRRLILHQQQQRQKVTSDLKCPLFYVQSDPLSPRSHTSHCQKSEECTSSLLTFDNGYSEYVTL